MRLEEPMKNEEIVDIELMLNEIDENEEIKNAVVFQQNTNFSSRYSLKLKRYSKYSIQFTVDSNITLKYLKFADKRFGITEKSFHITDDGRKSYQFVWSTNGVPKTKNSKRFIVSITMKFEEYKKLKYDLLVKFFRKDERSVYHGTKLSSIGLEFIVPRDPVSVSYDPEDDDSDSDDEPSSKSHIINDMTFKAMDGAD